MDKNATLLNTSILKKERQYSEGECQRQLAMLRVDEKQPPTTMSEDVFATFFQFPQDGANPHKLKIDKDIFLQDVEALFGKEKAQNGLRSSPQIYGRMLRSFTICIIKRLTPLSISRRSLQLALFWRMSEGRK
jgi:hypothetical protein